MSPPGADLDFHVHATIGITIKYVDPAIIAAEIKADTIRLVIACRAAFFRWQLVLVRIWEVERFPRDATVSSGQPGVVKVHDATVITLETLKVRCTVTMIKSPALSIVVAGAYARFYGRGAYRIQVNLCCVRSGEGAVAINVAEHGAWHSGIQAFRSHVDTRSHIDSRSASKREGENEKRTNQQRHRHRKWARKPTRCWRP